MGLVSATSEVPESTRRLPGVAFDGTSIWVTNFVSNNVLKIVPF